MLFTFFMLLLPPISLIKPIMYSLADVSPKENVVLSQVSLVCDRLGTGVLEETGSLELSQDPCWWLNSGASFFRINDTGMTISGTLPLNSLWRQVYSRTNPKDTDNGFQPQNIFRLVSKNKWQNITEELMFRVKDYNKSFSQNHNASNGVLLMSHYQNADTLYYAGLRVDGTAVIKKKINGNYITLAETPYIERSQNNEEGYSMFLPLDVWIGEKLVTQNNPDGTVSLDFFIDLSGSGTWKSILHVRDRQELSGSLPITSAGSIGVRSDFMDIEFKNFNIALP